MTKQDNIAGKIGPVIIRKNGYIVDPSSIHDLLKENRLMEFLNVNPKNVKQLRKFCEKYGFIPDDASGGWQKAFAEEQNEIRSIFEVAKNGSFTEKEATLITEKLKNLGKAFVHINKKQLLELRNEIKNLNKNNDYYDELEGKSNNDYLIEVKVAKSSTSSLWDELISLIKTKNIPRQCKNCHQFFLPNKHSPWQKFDCLSCKESYNKTHSHPK